MTSRRSDLVPARSSLVSACVFAVALAACSSTVCGPGGPGTDGGVSPADAGVRPVCGNRVCEAGESTATCPADCTAAVCGNGACEAGESASTCPADCATPPFVCGNGVCQAGESPASCPADCNAPPVCGDGFCDTSETPGSCPADCTVVGCPPVAGEYSLSASHAADPSCPPGPVAVGVTQSGCALTISGVFPTPISVSIDPTGIAIYRYTADGFPAAATFAFTPDGFFLTDDGFFAFCPGVGTRI